MESTGLVQAAAGLLAVAAAGGLVMAGFRLIGRRNPPPWLPMAHGFLASAALALLTYGAFATAMPPRALLALGLFALAAAGGVLMNLGFHQRQRPVPRMLLVGHGLLAVVALLLLLSVAFGFAAVEAA